MGYDNWNNVVPKDLLVEIVQRSSCPEDYYRFSAVCKSWNSAASEALASLADSVIAQKPWWLLILRFPTTTPMLLLAEEVAPGSIITDTGYDLNRDYRYDEEGYCRDDDDDGKVESYDHLKNSVGTSRGLYSLSSTKTYNIELPEASGKLILATSKGWLLTLGRDLQINLLHPLLRHQISLPSMLKFPRETIYPRGYNEEYASENYIRKVAMSIELPKKNTSASFLNHHGTPSPIVMVIYHHLGYLGFARLGDKVWSHVNVPSEYFHDIVYHKGKFYAVDCQGYVYVCCMDDEGGARGTKIASIVTVYNEEKYLVEPLSGSGLLLLVRNNRDKLFKKAGRVVRKYRTTHFDVWRLNLDYCDPPQENNLWYEEETFASCSLSQENNLGNEAIFVGRAASLSVPSSDIIKPNSIYFTDDHSEAYIRKGGGHDMGIFDLERRTVEPHYQGKSIHCISPPLWYI